MEFGYCPLEDLVVHKITLLFRSRLAMVLIAAVAVAAFLPSCSNVENWQKSKFVDPIMTYRDGTAQSHFDQKVFHSIEGAAGGFGQSAGGGCGCN